MPPTPPRDCLGYFQALGPLIAACVAVGVGVTQWRLQKQHLKQNLFEKRWMVYQATEEYLKGLVRRDGDIDMETKYNFLSDTNPGEFLFPENVWQHIILIGKIGSDLQTAKQGLTHLDPIAQDQNKRAEELYDESMRWIIHALEGCTRDVFSPHLRLAALDPWYMRVDDYMERLLECAEQRLKSGYTERPTMRSGANTRTKADQ